jgi:hypothetical protein
MKNVVLAQYSTSVGRSWERLAKVRWFWMISIE